MADFQMCISLHPLHEQINKVRNGKEILLRINQYSVTPTLRIRYLHITIIVLSVTAPGNLVYSKQI